jgi:hypothetical protein
MAKENYKQHVDATRVLLFKFAGISMLQNNPLFTFMLYALLRGLLSSNISKGKVSLINTPRKTALNIGSTATADTGFSL